MEKDDKKELELLREREKKRKERVKRQNDKYNESRDRISFDVPRGRKADIKALAEKSGMSVNAFLGALLLDIVDGKKKIIPADLQAGKSTRKST